MNQDSQETQNQKLKIRLCKYTVLAYLGAYGAHMFALWVWVGFGASL